MKALCDKVVGGKQNTHSQKQLPRALKMKVVALRRKKGVAALM